MLRDQRVDGWHASDVDDRDGGAVADNCLQQILHHHLCSLAVQRPNQRECQDTVPEAHYRSRNLEQFLLLAPDDLFPAF